MNKTKQLIIDSIFLGLLIVSSKISFPVGTISFTLQVLVVLIIALLFPLKDSILICGVYLFMGLVLQLPVFSTGGGIQYVLFPSFGFILGFIVCLTPVKLIDNMLSKKIDNKLICYLIASLIGLLIIYIFGLCYGFIIYKFYKGIDKTIMEMLQIFILPFLVFDLGKVVIATIISWRLQKILVIKERNK